MRTRFSWVILLAIIAFMNLGCGLFDGDDDTDGVTWQDAFIERVLVGNVPVQAGATVNIPLDHSYSIRFELSKPVTPASMSILFDYEIWVENLSTGDVFLLKPGLLDTNGELIWVDGSNRVIEYRADQPLSYITTGNYAGRIGSPGDSIRVRIQFLMANAVDGTQIAILDDAFYVVWTS